MAYIDVILTFKKEFWEDTFGVIPWTQNCISMVITEEIKEHFPWRNLTCGPTAASIPSCWLVFQTWRQLITGFPHPSFPSTSLSFLVMASSSFSLRKIIISMSLCTTFWPCWQPQIWSWPWLGAGSPLAGSQGDWKRSLLSSGLLATLTFLCEIQSFAGYGLMIILLPSSTPLDIPLYSLIL